RGEKIEEDRRTVGALIVDANDLLGHRHGLDAVDEALEPAFLVVDGDHDRELPPFGERVDADLPADGGAEQLREEFVAAIPGGASISKPPCCGCSNRARRSTGRTWRSSRKKPRPIAMRSTPSAAPMAPMRSCWPWPRST